MNALDENWKILLGLFPPDWGCAARRSGAVTRLRGFESVQEGLRTLLLHVGCGYSLRETAVRAKAAGVAEVSDVTLLNRLRQAEGWLQRLCQELLAENGVEWRGPQSRRPIRAVDATVIKEPGKTGSQWRLHFSLRLPELSCDFFQITAAEGQGNGEQLRRFPVAAGDIILADRGYFEPARSGRSVSTRCGRHCPSEHFLSAIVRAHGAAARFAAEVAEDPGRRHGSRMAGLGARAESAYCRASLCGAEN